jgi:hypothetical protein
MPDMLSLDKAAFSTLTPEQRLMAAIIRRAMDDLPLSRRFFQRDNWMFQLCCEALSLDPDGIRVQIAKKLKAKTGHIGVFSSASSF